MTRTIASMLLAAVLIVPAYAQTAECASRYSPCHVDARLYMAGIDDGQDARDFLEKLRTAVRSGDRKTLADMVSYPLTIYDNGEEIVVYRDAAALLRDFDEVFTPGVVQAIEAAKYQSLFVNTQGAMIGDGEIWLRGQDGAIQIKAINPPELR